jgi:hypothetical protein
MANLLAVCRRSGCMSVRFLAQSRPNPVGKSAAAAIINRLSKVQSEQRALQRAQRAFAINSMGTGSSRASGWIGAALTLAASKDRKAARETDGKVFLDFSR